MKKYSFKPYSPIFPELFLKECTRITPALSMKHVLEHVGSTAIVGLGGKGIIDLALAVYRDKIPLACSELEKMGYSFRPTFSTPHRAFLKIELPDFEEGSRVYHMHVTYPESEEWDALVGFRNYLRANPEEVAYYAELKKQAIQHLAAQESMPADMTSVGQDSSEEGRRYRAHKEPMFKRYREKK